MIFTARQLEDLHRSNGRLTLPVGARLTPLASDWVRARKIAVEFNGNAKPQADAAIRTPPLAASPHSSTHSADAPITPGTMFWWCDGPCGAAKAAIAAQARETILQPLQLPAEPKYLVAAVKQLARDMRSDRVSAGILLVSSGASAVVYANRCPSLRAILGTCRQAVQQGVEQVGANVLIIEYPHQTLPQARNLLSQFARGRRDLSEDVKQQFKELASCG
jgi:ribose 5-phosphate isomerase RpiB